MTLIYSRLIDHNFYRVCSLEYQYSVTHLNINHPLCTWHSFWIGLIKLKKEKKSESCFCFFVPISQYWNLNGNFINSFHSHNYLQYMWSYSNKKLSGNLIVFHRTFILRGWLGSFSLNSMCLHSQTSRLILFYSQKLPPFPHLGERSLTAPVKILQAERSHCCLTQAQRGFCYLNLHTRSIRGCSHLFGVRQNGAEFRGPEMLLF